jgi:hypothetical protein
VQFACDHSHNQYGQLAGDFLLKVLRGMGIFLAFLSASGTCARRPSGASGQVQRAGGAAVYRVGSWLVCRGIFESASWHQMGMAGRKDCLVATPHWGT